MGNIENIRTIYEENSLMCRAYLDWRHRVILRWFISLASMFILGKWLYDVDKTVKFIWIPMLGAACMSIVFYILDRGISQVLKISVEIGAEIENSLSPEVDGFYTRILKWLPETHNSNTLIWGIVYITSAILFFMGAIYFL